MTAQILWWREIISRHSKQNFRKFSCENQQIISSLSHLIRRTPIFDFVRHFVSDTKTTRMWFGFPVWKRRFAQDCGCAPPRTFPDLVMKLKARSAEAILGTRWIYTLFYGVLHQFGLSRTIRTGVCSILDVSRWILSVLAAIKPSIRWKSWTA